MNKSSQFTFFLQTYIFIIIKYSLIHQLRSPKMLKIYHCYLEKLLSMCFTAEALLTALQIDSARTWNQENNSI